MESGIGELLLKAAREGSPKDVEDILQRLPVEVDELQENGEGEKVTSVATCGARNACAPVGTFLHAAVNLDNLEKFLAEIRSGQYSINSTLSEMRNNQKDLMQTIGTIKIRMDEEYDKKICIEKMMLKTTIKNTDMESTTYVKELYTSLYERDILTSSLLNYLQRDDSFKVVIDCSSTSLLNIKSPYKNLDGSVFNGDKDSVFADREENIVYLAAKRSAYFTTNIITSRLARALAIMAINNLFHNSGKPYSEEDDEGRIEFQAVLTEAVEMKEKIPKSILYIPWAIDMKTELGKQARLAAVPAEYVAEYGSEKGRALLKAHGPNLLQFYEKHVMPKLKFRST